MAAKPVPRPRVVPRLLAPTLLGTDPMVTSRLLSQTASAVQQQGSQTSNSIIVVQDLAVGVNRINHGLGRRARAAHVTPTVADATFAWGFTTDNDTQIILTVAGVPQPNAAIEIK